MSNWSAWDWIAYGCLGVSALGLAFGTWGKENPEMLERLPSLFSSSKLAPVPAILFALATMIFIVRLLTPSPPSVASTNTDQSKSVTHGRLEYFKDPHLYLDGNSDDPILTFTGMPSVNGSFGVFVEYSTFNFSNTNVWSQRRRAFVQDIKIFKNQQVTIPIFVRYAVPGTGTGGLWWGQPNDSHGNFVEKGVTMASVVFLDQQGKETYLKFLLVKPDQSFIILKDQALDPIQTWDADEGK